MNPEPPTDLIFASDADFRDWQVQTLKMVENMKEVEASAVKLVIWRNGVIGALKNWRNRDALVEGNNLLWTWVERLRSCRRSMELVADSLGAIRKTMFELVRHGFYREEGLFHHSWPRAS